MPAKSNRSTAQRSDHQARSGFIERFASVLTASGFPRMPARVFAALLATDSGRLTAAELAAILHVSLAAISGAVRYLVQVNLASRESEPGSRREHYRVHSEVWYEAIASKDQVLDRCERSLREGIEVVGRDTPAGARIAETLGFFEFLQTELPAMMERWRARKAEARPTAERLTTPKPFVTRRPTPAKRRRVISSTISEA
jgi:predicted transcriptional regulator